MIPYFIAFIILLSTSIIDIFTKKIPATITTTFLLLELVIVGSKGIIFGLIFFILGILLIEWGSFDGGADLKILTAIGIIMPGRIEAAVFVTIMMFIGISYKFIIKLSFPKLKEVPYIPVFFLSFVAFLIITYGGMI